MSSRDYRSSRYGPDENDDGDDQRRYGSRRDDVRRDDVRRDARRDDGRRESRRARDEGNNGNSRRRSQRPHSERHNSGASSGSQPTARRPFFEELGNDLESVTSFFGHSFEGLGRAMGETLQDGADDLQRGLGLNPPVREWNDTTSTDGSIRCQWPYERCEKPASEKTNITVSTQESDGQGGVRPRYRDEERWLCIEHLPDAVSLKFAG